MTPTPQNAEVQVLGGVNIHLTALVVRRIHKPSSRSFDEVCCFSIVSVVDLPMADAR
jgi:hypothetical protein